MQEKGKFPSQTQQNPGRVHEITDSSEAAPKMDEVKAVITLRSGKKVEQPMPKPLDEAKEGQDDEPERIKTFVATNLSYNSIFFVTTKLSFVATKFIRYLQFSYVVTEL